MDYYYCFACKKLFKSSDSSCVRCGKGAAVATRKLVRSGLKIDVYQIYVGDKLVGNQRVVKRPG